MQSNFNDVILAPIVLVHNGATYGDKFYIAGGSELPDYSAVNLIIEIWEVNSDLTSSLVGNAFI